MTDREERRLAERIRRLEQTVDALSKSRQLSASTVPLRDAEGALYEVPLPDAVGRGVLAADDALLALERATQAQESADGKATIFRSIDEPDPAQGTVGDRWEQYDKTGTPWKLLGAWSREATGWEPVELDSTYLPLVDIGNGTFGQLGGARLEADALYGKQLFGNEIYGGYVAGSVLELLGFSNNSTVLSDPLTSLTGWSALAGASIALASSPFRSSPTSMRVTTGGGVCGASRTISPPAAGVQVSVWVYSTVATQVQLTVYSLKTFVKGAIVEVPPSTWTQVTVAGSDPVSGTWVSARVECVAATKPAQMFVDDLVVTSTSADTRRVVIDRDALGHPAFRGMQGVTPTAELLPGAIGGPGMLRLRTTGGAAASGLTVNNAAIWTDSFNLGPNGLRLGSGVASPFIRTSHASGFGIESEATGASIDVNALNGDINIGSTVSTSGVVRMRRPVEFLGDADWVYPTLIGGTNIVGNEFGFCKLNGVVWLTGRVNSGDGVTIYQMPAGFRIRGGADNVRLLDRGGPVRVNFKGTGHIEVLTGGLTGGGVSFAGTSYLAAPA